MDPISPVGGYVVGKSAISISLAGQNPKPKYILCFTFREEIS